MACRCEDILRVETLPDPCASGLCVGQQAQVGDDIYELAYDPLGPCGRAWKLLTGGGSGDLAVQDEGVLVGTRPILNFIGPGVTATDDPPDNRVDVTITAAVVGATLPTTVQPDDAPNAGVSVEAARADHRHGIAAAAAGTIAVGDAAAEGASTSFARADHQHALPAPAAPANIDHTAAAAGVATTAARADHKHDVNVAAPVATGSANAIGVAATLALSDHVHQTLVQVQDEGVLAGTRGIINFIGAGVAAVDDGGGGRVNVTISAAVLTNAAPANVDHAAAAVGVAAEAARADHKHDVNVAAPGTIAVGDAAATGVATTLALSDHRHALPAPAAPADVTKAAASAGVATTVARADHKHDASTAAPVATGSANAEGTATSLARSDHVHQTLIQVQDEGVLAGTRGIINFIGAGVAAVDDGGGGRVNVTIPGATDTNTPWLKWTGRVVFGGGAVTRYLSDYHNDSSDALLNYPAPAAATAVVLVVRMNANQANVNSVITLMVNGVATAVALTYAATVTGTQSTGTVALAVAANDLLDVRVASGGNGGDNLRLSVTLQLTR